MILVCIEYNLYLCGRYVLLVPQPTSNAEQCFKHPAAYEIHQDTPLTRGADWI